MRTALGIVIGLAARAEVTLFDEPYAGLDAVARQLFYDRLLAEYVEHPRTFLLSTHLIDEAADLLERVVMIDHGRIVLDAVADDVRGAATTVSGPTAAVEAFVAGRPTWDRRRIAAQESVVIGETLDAGDRARARELHLDLTAPVLAAGNGPRRRAGPPKTPAKGRTHEDPRQRGPVPPGRPLHLHRPALGPAGLRLRRQLDHRRHDPDRHPTRACPSAACPASTS